MKILAIETSCDETAAAIIEDGTKILSNVVASSKDLHDKTGGIIPEVAAREQVRCIIPVIDEALLQTTNNKHLLSDIDALAVTVGPGLNGSLLIGVETAKTLAFATDKPIIPVNHIFAHIYANWLFPQLPTTNYSRLSGIHDAVGFNNSSTASGQLPTFPAIALVVSGGHTELFLLSSHRKIKWLGGTRDDAAGEAFDKTARLLGLGFPGGPAIAAAAAEFSNRYPEFISGSNQMLKSPRSDRGILAETGRVQHDIEKLPRPMIHSDDLNFSFSGLKTAVLREINKLKSLKQFNDKTIQQLSYEIQESITDVLVKKTLDAARKYKVKSILLGGGVAANQRLTEKFKFKIENLKLSRRLRDPAEAGKIHLHIPPPSLCTDNAAYIGSFAYFHNQPKPWKDINAQPDLNIEV